MNYEINNEDFKDLDLEHTVELLKLAVGYNLNYCQLYSLYEQNAKKLVIRGLRTGTLDANSCKTPVYERSLCMVKGYITRNYERVSE